MMIDENRINSMVVHIAEVCMERLSKKESELGKADTENILIVLGIIRGALDLANGLKKMMKE